MIGSTLDFVAQQLNSYICNALKINPSSNKVLLSAIVEPGGEIAVKEPNVLLLKLINIEPDPIANGSEPVVRHPRGSDIVESAPLYLNLRFILAAYFKPEQVKMGQDMLTLGISYLQGKPLWNPQNTPELPDNIQRLVFEMGSLDLHQLNHVWGAIGTKYLPSAIYKVRMLTVDNHAFREFVPVVKTTASSINRTD